MNDLWKEQTYGLRFKLSDLTLGRIDIPVLMHACSLSEIFAGRQPTFPAKPPHPYRGYLVRSCPGPASPRIVVAHGDYVAYTTAAYEHCYIDLRGGFAAYKATFSSKSRGTINRKLRKLEGASGETMRFVRYASPDELSRFHEQARRVSALTYQERLLDAGLPEGEDFEAAMLDRAARDRVRAYVLFLGERPVAYLYCPVEDDSIVYAYLGFDPALAHLSPGTVLLWLSLESLFAEDKFRYFDFTEGDSPQKRFFSTDRLPCHNRLFLQRGLGSHLLVRSHHLFDEASRRTGLLLDRAGLKQKIKHLLRGT